MQLLAGITIEKVVVIRFNLLPTRSTKETRNTVRCAEFFLWVQSGVTHATVGYETDERSLLGERGIKRLITVFDEAMSADSIVAGDKLSALMD